MTPNPLNPPIHHIFCLYMKIMASNSLSYMLLLALLHLLLLIQPSRPNDLVEKVCIYTDDSAFCNQILNSDGRTPNADLALLGHIAIDQGLVLGTNISNLIIWKNTSATDAGLVECFNTCFKGYDVAKDELVYASNSLSSTSYSLMNDHAAAAGQFGLWCEEAFKQQPPRPSPLTVENNNFYHLCQAMVVISNMLLTGGFL